MRSTWAMLLLLSTAGFGVGQQYYSQTQPGYYPASYPRLHPHPPQVRPANSRIPQLVPYPSLDVVPAAERRPVNEPKKPQAFLITERPSEQPAADQAANGSADAPLTDLPPESPGTNAAQNADPYQAEVEVIKPTPMSEVVNPPAETLPATPEATVPQTEVTSPAVECTPVVECPPPVAAIMPATPVVLVEQKPQPTLLGHFFHLEQLHSLVNYAVPVHYPRTQLRGPMCYADAYFTIFRARPQSTPVRLLSAGANVVVGGGELDYEDEPRYGGRGVLGGWLDHEQTCALEVGLLAFVESQEEFSGQNLTTNTNQNISAVLVSSSRFWTAEANYRSEITRGALGNLDWLAGFRFSRLDESFSLRGLNTSYRTENLISTGQLGVQAELFLRRCSINGWCKANVGHVSQRVRVAESGNFGPAEDSDSRSHTFAMMLDCGATVGIRLSNFARFSAGYSTIILENIARPVNQIDNSGDSRYWLQGISGGFEFRF